MARNDQRGREAEGAGLAEAGRKRNGRFGVSNGNKQTFVHGHCQRQPSTPMAVARPQQPQPELDPTKPCMPAGIATPKADIDIWLGQPDHERSHSSRYGAQSGFDAQAEMTMAPRLPELMFEGDERLSEVSIAGISPPGFEAQLFFLAVPVPAPSVHGDGRECSRSLCRSSAWSNQRADYVQVVGRNFPAWGSDGSLCRPSESSSVAPMAGSRPPASS